MGWRRYLWRCLLAAGILCLLGLLMISIDGMIDDKDPADLIIVPGNKIELDGHPSPWLAARLDTAARLYHTAQARAILVSGGLGKEGFAEAEVMKAYLLAAGVPEDAVWVDNAGDDSWLTAEHAADLMQARGWSRALVVSQFYHLPRMKLALSRWGIAWAGGVHASGFYMRNIPGLVRELAAYPYYLARSK